jgi:hypothetical protein
MALWHKALRTAMGRMPKVIDPTTHTVLDYAVAGSFLLMGVLFWKRSKRAALGSLFCGGATAANILLTDYPGGTHPIISYQTHGHVDQGLAAMTAAVPRLMRFDDEREARFFEVEALANIAISGLTDFEYYERPSPRRQLRRREEEVAWKLPQAGVRSAAGQTPQGGHHTPR